MDPATDADPTRRSAALTHGAVTASRVASAARRLARAPAFSGAVVVNLTLGLGAVGALFSVLEGVVLRPLPYPSPERLVVIEHELAGIDLQGEAVRFGGFQGLVPLYEERSRQLEAVGLHGSYEAAVTSGEAPLYVRVGFASEGFFRALGNPPAAGRALRSDEPTPEAAGRGVALLGRDLWRQQYGADAGILGRQLDIEGYRYEVVGVAPATGPFPALPVQVWTPRSGETMRDNPDWVIPGIVGRLTEGATPDSLRRELDGIVGELAERTDGDFVRRAIDAGQLRSVVTPLRARVLGSVERSMWLVFAAGALLLAVALVNAMNLMLMRAEALRGELAVRRALGARERDMMMFHATEALLLVGLSTIVAYGVATTSIGALVRLGPSDVPRLAQVTIGWQATLIVALLAAGCGVVATWTPRLVAGRTIGALRGHGRNAGTAGRHRTRAGLAAAQLGIAAALLSTCGLLVRSFVALSAVDPGFDPDDLLTFRVPFPLQEVQQAGRAGGASVPFYDQLATRLASLPGVESVGYGKCLPLAPSCAPDGLTLEREDLPAPGGGTMQGIVQVATGYHRTLGIPLRAGRYLEATDHVERTNAALLSESVARQLFGDEDPVGARLVTPDLPTFSPFTVVGVVGDAHHGGLRGEREPIVYVPINLREQDLELWTVSFVVRSRAEATTLVDSIRSVVAELRPDVPVAQVETMRSALRRTTGRLRFATWLLALAGATALVIGATGVYSVFAYSVRLRRGELGVRAALGADGAALRRLVFRQVGLTTTAGVVAGVAAAATTARLLGSLLYGIGPSDAATHLAVATLLALTVLTATLGPARRAAKADPVEILRSL